jgi:hypothetical protein
LQIKDDVEVSVQYAKTTALLSKISAGGWKANFATKVFGGMFNDGMRSVNLL